MGIALGHSCITVPKQLRQGVEVNLVRDGVAGKGMPQIMQMKIDQADALFCPAPGLLHRSDRTSLLLPRKDMVIADMPEAPLSLQNCNGAIIEGDRVRHP